VSRKTSRKQSEQMDDFNLTKHVHNTEHVNTELIDDNDPSSSSD